MSTLHTASATVIFSLQLPYLSPCRLANPARGCRNETSLERHTVQYVNGMKVRVTPLRTCYGYKVSFRVVHR